MATDATAASTQKLLDKEREKHRASKRAAKLAADQAKGLKQALETEKQRTAAAEERARQFEVALFEERARSAKALAEQRAECLEAAVEVAREIAERQPQTQVMPGPGPPARRASTQATELARGAPSTWSEASQRASVLGVGILFKARQLRAHHGPCLEGDGEPLKETLTAIAHPYGGAPPLSPAEALPAALACVDFCVVALPALLDSASTTDEGVLATLKSAASTAASKVASTVDQVLWEEENVDIATLSRPALKSQVDSMLAQGPAHKSEEMDGTSL